MVQVARRLSRVLFGSRFGSRFCVRHNYLMLWSALKSLRKSGAAPAAAERRLHIGGQVRKEGWEVLDAIAGQAVDHLGHAQDLGRFADQSFVAVYSSHCLEHLDFIDEVGAALGEWYRVLAPGGRLYVSVPDLAALARLILLPGLTLEGRLSVMKMQFGAHRDDYDYHKTGFDYEILRHFLQTAGFAQIERVDAFGLFEDYSTLVSAGIPVSVNVTAVRPDDGSADGPADGAAQRFG